MCGLSQFVFVHYIYSEPIYRARQWVSSLIPFTEASITFVTLNPCVVFNFFFSFFIVIIILQKYQPKNKIRKLARNISKFSQLIKYFTFVTYKSHISYNSTSILVFCIPIIYTHITFPRLSHKDMHSLLIIFLQKGFVSTNWRKFTWSYHPQKMFKKTKKTRRWKSRKSGGKAFAQHKLGHHEGQPLPCQFPWDQGSTGSATQCCSSTPNRPDRIPGHHRERSSWRQSQERAWTRCRSWSVSICQQRHHVPRAGASSPGSSTSRLQPGRPMWHFALCTLGGPADSPSGLVLSLHSCSSWGQKNSLITHPSCFEHLKSMTIGNSSRSSGRVRNVFVSLK